MYQVHTMMMSCMLDTNRGSDLVLEHHSIHVTHTQYRFPQASNIKQHPLDDFCKHSTFKYVPSTCLEQIVRTRYVLGVKRTYFKLYVQVHTHADPTHTSFSIRKHHCYPQKSPSYACPALCWQHPSYPKSPRLSDCLFHCGCI
jgi:hypothetical protein